MARWQDMKGGAYVRKEAIWQLILLNVFVFAALLLIGFFFSFSETTASYGKLINEQLRLSAPIEQLIRRPWALVTYSFMHRDGWHLLWNMLTLFWFGTWLEDLIRGRKLVVVYLLGGLFSGLVYVMLYNVFAYLPASLAIRNVSPIIEGASASVMAVMFATTTLVPQAEFFFLRSFPIKIKYIAWFVLFISLLNPSSGVSHAAGAAFGYLYIKLLGHGIDVGAPLERFLSWWSRDSKPAPMPTRRYPASPVYSATTPTKPAKDINYYPDQDEVDAILDKISKSGYDSLTKEEKSTLYRASQRKD